MLNFIGNISWFQQPGGDLVMRFSLIMLLIVMALCFTIPASAAQRGSGGKETAIFAGGCFWCMEAPFDKLEGVFSVTPGYSGGAKKNPTYEEVSSGGTGHAEAVQIVFDPGKISYKRLLEVFWHNIDPTVVNRQFCDVGRQYRSAIFFHGAEQQKVAVESRKALEKSKPFPEPIVTEIVPASEFYPAEEYHQHYYKKNPIRYSFYRKGCGRDKRLQELWGEKAGH
jgi:peptide-methionine (S)-S-oxide reductase